MGFVLAKAHTGALSRSTLLRFALTCLFASFEWLAKDASRSTIWRFALTPFLNSDALGKMLSFALKKTDFGVKLEK